VPVAQERTSAPLEAGAAPAPVRALRAHRGLALGANLRFGLHLRRLSPTDPSYPLAPVGVRHAGQYWLGKVQQSAAARQLPKAVSGLARPYVLLRTDKRAVRRAACPAWCLCVPCAVLIGSSR